MKCNQNPDLKCNNEDFHKCKTCKAPTWCQCKRPERLEAGKKLWANTGGR